MFVLVLSEQSTQPVKGLWLEGQVKPLIFLHSGNSEDGVIQKAGFQAASL